LNGIQQKPCQQGSCRENDGIKRCKLFEPHGWSDISCWNDADCPCLCEEKWPGDDKLHACNAQPPAPRSCCCTSGPKAGQCLDTVAWNAATCNVACGGSITSGWGVIGAEGSVCGAAGSCNAMSRACCLQGECININRTTCVEKGGVYINTLVGGPTRCTSSECPQGTYCCSACGAGINGAACSPQGLTTCTGAITYASNVCPQPPESDLCNCKQSKK
jgi:hypothetical protein